MYSKYQRTFFLLNFEATPKTFSNHNPIFALWEFRDSHKADSFNREQSFSCFVYCELATCFRSCKFCSVQMTSRVRRHLAIIAVLIVMCLADVALCKNYVSRMPFGKRSQPPFFDGRTSKGALQPLLPMQARKTIDHEFGRRFIHNIRMAAFAKHWPTLTFALLVDFWSTKVLVI